jgi:hypothetical protein
MLDPFVSFNEVEYCIIGSLYLRFHGLWCQNAGHDVHLEVLTCSCLECYKLFGSSVDQFRYNKPLCTSRDASTLAKLKFVAFQLSLTYF